MKNIRSASILNDLPTTEFDVVLLGVNLPGVLLAWHLASAGKKVALFCADDFARRDDFRFTQIFPGNIKSVAKARPQLEMAAKMRRHAPYLFLQQRMIWLRGNPLANKLVTQAYNQLSVRSHSERAGTLNLTDYPDYELFAKNGYSHGILCREYRYNHSRLVMEWLKAASRAGAFVGNFVEANRHEGKALQLDDKISGESKMIDAEKVIQLISNPRLFTFTVNLPNDEWNNPVRISGEKADYILSPEGEVVRVTAYCNIAPDAKGLIHKEFCQLFSLQEEDISPAENREKNFAHPVESDLTLSDLPVEIMEEELSRLFPEYMEWKLPDNWFRGEDDRHISQVFEMAQRKFYEAKQTGIDETWFMELFYRYGNAIDELTEMAYGGMSETRDPILLWEKSILKFEREQEWRMQ
ncbi:hypothetical protein PbJCM13498_17630 [Prolixibacter bellariivorans]|uniref:Uncharacterized protein n=1 Tax=Prolixibacter bellariivorans TaxID=314319 RepID=A0A5M4AYC2_9BACT|nr:hypothetical protein [Prolixibacter bellariivorans]GET32900.1 hypothetical protein PbJCM13498_17630 [Prolixibacter bellariivorans]